MGKGSYLAPLVTKHKAKLLCSQENTRYTSKLDYFIYLSDDSSDSIHHASLVTNGSSDHDSVLGFFDYPCIVQSFKNEQHTKLLTSNSWPIPKSEKKIKYFSKKCQNLVNNQ